MFSILGYTRSVKCPIYFVLSVERVNPYSSHLQALCFSLLFTMPKMVVIGRCRLVPGITFRRKCSKLRRFSFVAVERRGSWSLPVKERLRVIKISRFLILLIGLGCRTTAPKSGRPSVRVGPLLPGPEEGTFFRPFFRVPAVLCGESAEKAPIMTAIPIRRPS